MMEPQLDDDPNSHGAVRGTANPSDTVCRKRETEGGDACGVDKRPRVTHNVVGDLVIRSESQMPPQQQEQMRCTADVVTLAATTSGGRLVQASGVVSDGVSGIRDQHGCCSARDENDDAGAEVGTAGLVDAVGGRTAQALNGPVEIAPGVVKLAPFDRSIHSSVVLSKPSQTIASIPPTDFTEMMDDAGKTVGRDKHDLTSTLPAGTPADRPPIPLDERTTRSRQERASKEEQDACCSWKLPTCSSWFSEDSISQLESDLLPSIFSGNFLSQVERDALYLQLRREILELYRRNPLRHLSFTECRRTIACDAALLLRIHSFLDYWGIINFQANPETVPSSVKKKKEFLLKDLEAWKRSAAFEKVSCTSVGVVNQQTSNAPCGQGPWRCAACGKICMYSYYVLKPGSTSGVSLGVLDNCVWCLRCFADGRYPHVLTARHFLKVDLPINDSSGEGSEWKLDETERLIEGIELYKEDWREIAEHVGNGRTPQQCVERFIQLPIQEPFIDAAKATYSGTESLPFSDFANPLLSLLALLSSVVHPAVAATAARAALEKSVELTTPVRRLREIGALSSDERDSTASMKKQMSDGGCAPANDKDDAHMRSAGLDATDGLVNDEEIQVACATALAAGAASAEELAAVEEHNLKSLMSQLVDHQLRRLELKFEKIRNLERTIGAAKSQMEGKLDQLMSEHRKIESELRTCRQLAPTQY